VDERVDEGQLLNDRSERKRHMKITLEGDAERVKMALRTLLMDVPDVTPEGLEIYDDGTAKVTVDIPEEHELLASRIVTNALP
jgi:hypothetical protein